MDAHHIINPSESLATVSHHRPLPTLIRQHENRSCCVSLYWRVSPRLGSSFRALLLFLVAFLSCNSLAAPVFVAGAHGDRPVLLVEDDLAWTGSALRLDLSPPPTVPQLMPPLQRDDDDDDDDTTHIHNAPPLKRALDTDPSNAGSGDFSIPTAFDSGLSNNFTNSCAKFLNSMRQQNDFKNCHPFSLLMQTSSGFFDASKSTLRITQTLDATCGVNATQCQTVMNKYALQMLSPSACPTDYAGDNPTVLGTYNGLIAYMPAYQASCLHDDQGNYCFANAVSNITSPGDAYPFYLPIGQQLPGGSRPTCNSCLRQEMGVFASYSTNTTQPISKTYTSAAQQIAIACGSNFIDVKAAPAKSAASATSAPLTPTITLILMFLLFLFQ